MSSIKLKHGIVSGLATTSALQNGQVNGGFAHTSTAYGTPATPQIKQGTVASAPLETALANMSRSQTLQTRGSAAQIVSVRPTTAPDLLPRKGGKKKKSKTSKDAEVATCIQPTNATQVTEGLPCPTSTYSGGVRHTGPRHAAHFVAAAAGALGGGWMGRR